VLYRPQEGLRARLWEQHSVIFALVLSAVWIALGVGYTMQNQGFDLTTAVYFAITTMSTGGLEVMDIVISHVM
jgi:hypothetical protein